MLSRHVVLVVSRSDEASRRSTIAWIRALAERSPRGHVLVLAAPAGWHRQPTPLTAPGSTTDAGSRWASERARDRIGRLARPSGPRRSSLRAAAELAVRGQPRSAAIATGNAGQEKGRARRMRVVSGVPALLQIVQEADDEVAALAGACAWVRRQTGADRVGDRRCGSERRSSAPTGGRAATSPRPTWPLRWSRTDVSARVVGGLVLISAPVRYSRRRRSAACVTRGRARTIAPHSRRP